MRPVILSGGSGTRLWPVSTPEKPKQFATLVPGGPLFEQTIRRLTALTGVQGPLIVTGRAQLGLVNDSVAAVGVRPSLTVVEPEGRNTAPAAIAAAVASDPDDVLVILPSDHLIRDRQRFVAEVEKAGVIASTDLIVTFGIRPTAPLTGYGYIELGDRVNGAYRVVRFKEKPEAAEAERLAGDGKHVWNSGMFVVKASVLISEAAEHCPDVLTGVTSAMTEPVDGVIELGPGFTEVESVSLDHAIMENTNKAAVMPLDVGWDDVGSFDALWSVSSKDADGNALVGDVIVSDVSDSLVSATSRTVAVTGLCDVVVVETSEAVLVVPRDRAQEVKALVEELGAG